MYHNLLTCLNNRILTVIINRESKLNALNKETLRELNLIFSDAFEDASVGGIILTGQGRKAFAAGADITELKDLDKTEAYQLTLEANRNVFDFIEQGAKPVIAAINGYALGGGLELALACHIRIASQTSLLGFPEVSLGLIPGYGGTQRLPRLIGKGRAFEMILSGNSIDAKTALNYGLLNQVVGEDSLQDSAITLMEKILSRSPVALSAAIRCINSDIDSDGRELEKQEFSKCFETSDFNEGTRAFIEKRSPNFLG
jgi:enoyl-CoA hydratase